MLLQFRRPACCAGFACQTSSLFAFFLLSTMTTLPLITARNVKLLEGDLNVAQLDMSDSDHFWFDLVSKPPPSSGLLVKSGMLPLSSWSSNDFNPTTFQRWLAANGLSRDQMLASATAKKGSSNAWRPAQSSMPTPLSQT